MSPQIMFLVSFAGAGAGSGAFTTTGAGSGAFSSFFALSSALPD